MTDFPSFHSDYIPFYGSLRPPSHMIPTTFQEKIAKSLPTDVVPKTFKGQLRGCATSLYNDYIKDYKLVIFLVVLTVGFLIFRYKSTQRKKKIARTEGFREGPFNVPPFNQFIPYQDQIMTKPIHMNPTPQLINGRIDQCTNPFGREYVHGLDTNSPASSDLVHPYGWEGSFNDVDDRFMNPMIQANNQNVIQYEQIVNTKNADMMY